MISFNISGAILELPADVSLSFQRKNILFAFNKIEVSRSQAFDVPATARNNRIFANGNNIADYGAGMRTRLDAIMQYDGGSVSGYLYCSGATRDSYSCIFVYGELQRLKAIKDAGNIDEYLTTDLWCNWSDGVVPRSGGEQTANMVDFGVYKYHNGVDAYIRHGINYLPSVRLKYLLEQCANFFGIGLSVDDYSERYARARVLPPKLMSRGLQSTLTLSAEASDQSSYEWLGRRSGSSSITSGLGIYLSRYTYTGRTQYNDSFSQYTQDFYRAERSCRITFPSDFSDDLFMVTPEKDFLGDYSFEWYTFLNSNRRSGVGLAGREVKITKGDCFTFVYAIESANAISNSEVFELAVKQYSFNVTIEDDLSGEVEYGNPVYLQPNLPSVSFIDLLKATAYMLGGVIYYDADEETINIEPLNISDWSVKHIAQNTIVEIGQIERTFADYAQDNTVEYSSADYVRDGDRIVRRYGLANANLQAEKKLYTIPFNEGSAYSESRLPTNYARIDDIEREVKDDVAGYKIDGKKHSLLHIGTIADSYAERMPIAVNEGLQSLLDASTKITASVVMPLYEFQRLNEHVLLELQGQLYVWTSMQYTDGVVKFDLNKVYI